MSGESNIVQRVARFYIDGFRNMTIGRTLWAVIIIKLVVIFAVLKLLFFPNVLERDYTTDSERAAAVREALAPASEDNNQTSQ